MPLSSSSNNGRMILGFVPILVIGLVLGAYLGVSLSSSNVSRITDVNYSGPGIGTQTINSTSGLELELSINASQFSPGQGISINVTEYNTLPGVNSQTASDNWAITGLSLGPCGSHIPAGITVFRGYFSLNNISQASSSNDSLQFYAPGFYSCPAMFVIQSYSFQPNSDNASFAYECTPAPCYSEVFPQSATVDFNGSWSSPSETPVLSNLTQGVYTVAAGDEWRQLVLLHFIVS